MDCSSSADLLYYSKAHNPTPPPRLGRRYDRKGNFLPEPGNTVVCHLVEGSHTERAIIEARAKYLSMPEASLFAFTPIASLHMTLFQGIIEYRRHIPFWPEDVPFETPIGDMTALFLERLKSFAGGDPFRVHVTKAKPTGLVVEGISGDDRDAMKRWRNAFAHITFSYPIERLDEAALPRWQQLLNDVVAEISERAPMLEMRPPAFCSFEDMKHFQELRVFNFV
jgi:hypothetical protein